MKSLGLTSLFFIIFAVGVGCSTRKNPIDRNPLSIRNPMGKPVSEEGSMRVSEAAHLYGGQTFSAFLWPEHPTIDRVTLSNEVSTLSRTIDRLTMAYRETDAKLLYEQGRWTAWRCNQETDKPTGNTQIQDCEKFIRENDAHTACSCILDNKPLREATNQENLNQRMALGEKIVAMVEDDFDPGHNWLMGAGSPESRIGSVLKLRPPTSQGKFEVYVRLKNFGQEGVSYRTPATQKSAVEVCVEKQCNWVCEDSTLEVFTLQTGQKVCVTPDKDVSEGKILNGRYDSASRTLAFDLYEKEKDGTLTGNVYYFAMERGFIPEGTPDLVRFKGNILKMGANGKPLGKGGAKFDGEWSSDYR